VTPNARTARGVLQVKPSKSVDTTRGHSTQLADTCDLAYDPVRLCQLIAGQHDHQARRGMTASGLDAYAAVGRVVSSCQLSNLRPIS
jgi:hypothetical protein